MDISIISIGNSKGIRLSKTVLEKYQIQNKMELILKKDHMILKPKRSVRKGWEKAFKKMRENGDDLSLIPDVFKEETSEEWK